MHTYITVSRSEGADKTIKNGRAMLVFSEAHEDTANTVIADARCRSNGVNRICSALMGGGRFTVSSEASIPGHRNHRIGRCAHAPLKKLVGSPKDVINADIIKIGKSTQHLRRHHSLAAFIIGIRPLRNVYGLPHLLLREVCILSEISNTLIFLQFNHRFKYSLNKLVY